MFVKRVMKIFMALCVCMTMAQAGTLTVTPSDTWASSVAFPADPLFSRGTSRDSARWVKFSILLEPYDANIVHFQDSRQYVFHYEFASQHLDPFLGMTSAQFNAVTLFEQNQQAILGTVVLPPLISATETEIQEYGIQFVRQDPFTREEIAELFYRVKDSIQASDEVQAFYFPTYEQQAVAQANQAWFESQGIPLGSTARWAEGNTCYSQGWALGTLKYVTASEIDHAYQTGALTPQDILLTDGIPAELPYVAGIVSLVPSTPNSHVAILANTYVVPFVYLALPEDALQAQALVDHRIVLSVYNDELGGCDTRFIDTEGQLDDTIVEDILTLKKPTPLAISPMQPYGDVAISTEVIHPNDVCYVGGKASNFGILRHAVPDNSPRSLGLTFDVWNSFLDQPMTRTDEIVVQPGAYVVIYADSDVDQGPLHADFKLSKNGEAVILVASDGVTILDEIEFDKQKEDLSYGRVTDGGDIWQILSQPTPGQANANEPGVTGTGLLINEVMADNTSTLEDPDEAGDWPDWIELYNASTEPVTLNGMYLTDKADNPTKWRVAAAVSGHTLREEIQNRLAQYPSYPPTDMQQLSVDLEIIRNLFRDPALTQFDPEVAQSVIEQLLASEATFDPNAMLRFRSSTNVEDSADFTGAGLYESYSGCLQDDLSDDTNCACDPNRTSKKGVFEAIRKTFSSFYNDNAYLERLRRDVNELDVGMGVLVHHSFPDDLELANGVATIEYDSEYDNLVISLVTQAGAVSVTNPVDASIPEEVQVQVLSSGAILPKIVQSSSLVPLGGTVMTWRDDYVTLSGMLSQVYDEFGLVTGKQGYALDLEYKLMAPGGAVIPDGGLVIKQVRQMPEPDGDQKPFMLNASSNLELYTGEMAINQNIDVFAFHRLKSKWCLENRSLVFDANTLSQGLYTQLSLEYHDQGQIYEATYDLNDELFERQGSLLINQWALSDVSNPRTYTLNTRNVPTVVSQGENPVLTLEDLGEDALNVPFKGIALHVDYTYPVLSWTGDPETPLKQVDRNSLYLWVPPTASDDDLLQERQVFDGDIIVTTRFYFPPPPEGVDTWAQLTGATGPLLRWDETVILGLTQEPLVLKNYYAQTYRPEHHNEIEHFLFEPRLEPSLSQAQLDELAEKDVMWISVTVDNTGAQGTVIQTYGFDAEHPME